MMALLLLMMAAAVESHSIRQRTTDTSQIAGLYNRGPGYYSRSTISAPPRNKCLNLVVDMIQKKIIHETYPMTRPTSPMNGPTITRSRRSTRGGGWTGKGGEHPRSANPGRHARPRKTTTDCIPQRPCRKPRPGAKHLVFFDLLAKTEILK